MQCYSSFFFSAKNQNGLLDRETENLYSIRSSEKLFSVFHLRIYSREGEKERESEMPTQLTQEEIDSCRDAFLQYDKDRSGSIDQWELKEVLESNFFFFSRKTSRTNSPKYFQQLWDRHPRMKSSFK